MITAAALPPLVTFIQAQLSETFITTIVIAVLSFLSGSGLITLFFTRRNRKADETNTLAAANQSLTQNVISLQTENQKNYQDAIELRNEKEKLETRLADRDSQIRAMTVQLEYLQSEEKRIEDIHNMLTQLEVVLKVNEAQQILMKDKDRAIASLKAQTAPLPPLEEKRS